MICDMSMLSYTSDVLVVPILLTVLGGEFTYVVSLRGYYLSVLLSGPASKYD
jgi:hypothetical protein